MNNNSKLKSILFVVSLVFNGLVILFIFMSSFSNTRFISIPKLNDDYITAAAVISVPKGNNAVFNPTEIALNPKEKIFIQYAFIINGEQGNFMLNALFDPDVISVTQTPFGIEITALAAGETLIQSIALEGVVDIARIYVFDNNP